jgi:Ca2+-binding RTX toxin-like protein
MRSRSLPAATLALVLWPAAGCIPPGASFSPSTGVLTIAGTAAADSFLVRAQPNGSIVVNGGAVPIRGGTPTVATTTRIVLLGYAGDDQLVLDPAGGALPAARFQGGPGVDVLVGGAGDDEFLWVAGDGADTIEGQGGTDALLVQGGNDTTVVDLAESGARALLSVDGATIDSDDVETIDLAVRGGSDTVDVDDLTGTALTELRIDLPAVDGGGDGRTDTITIEGGPGADAVAVTGDSDAVVVSGLQTAVVLSHPEPSDVLSIATRGGPDIIDATAVDPDVLSLEVDGGPASDFFVGSEGADHFTGGGTIDTAFLGGGDDTFAWSPDDGDDVIEGQAGFDTLVFDGSDGGEDFEISANGGRSQLLRNVGNVTMDMNDVEAIEVQALGGADEVVVGDVSATDLVRVSVSLATRIGTGDGQPDAVFVEGTGDDDVALVVGDASAVSVLGLGAQVEITGAEDPDDRLNVSTFAGEDVLEASGLATPSIAYTAEGGAHADVLIGGEGDDELLGGDGDDTLLGGPGTDTLDGGSGSNILIQ